jgi:hypothetical protein
VTRETVFGLDSFSEVSVDPSGRPLSDAETVRLMIEEAVLAEAVGIDSFNIGALPPGQGRFGRSHDPGDDRRPNRMHPSQRRESSVASRRRGRDDLSYCGPATIGLCPPSKRLMIAWRLAVFATPRCTLDAEPAALAKQVFVSESAFREGPHTTTARSKARAIGSSSRPARAVSLAGLVVARAVPGAGAGRCSLPPSR